MMYLLDTGVAYELRKAKGAAEEAGLAAWIASVPRANLHLSAVTLLELEAAAGRLERGDRVKAAAVREWVDQQLVPAFEGRILPVDAAVARRRARLAYGDPRDGILAATALEHGMTLATGDPAAFRLGKVKVFDPHGYKPEAEAEEDDWGQLGKAGPLWLRNLFVRS